MERTAGAPFLSPENEGQIHFCLDRMKFPTFDLDPYPSLTEKTAYILTFIIERHPFADGNKRSATAIAAYFLEKNGYILELHGQEGAAMALGIGNGNVTFSQLVDWIGDHIRPK